MARVLQVGDLLVHTIDNLEVRLLLALVKTLQVGRLASPLLGREEAFG